MAFTVVVLVCSALPAYGADSHCEAALDSLRQSIRDNDFQAYARLIQNDDWFACTFEDELLALLGPDHMRNFGESLERLGIDLVDTSLHRLEWEQVRWSFIRREQMERFSDQRELAAPESTLSKLNWSWWIGGGCLAISLALFLWGSRLTRVSDARAARLGEWSSDVLDFQKALEAARTPEQFDRALFWLRFIHYNEQMMALKMEEWTRLSLRERELCLMLLEHWDASEICNALQVSNQHFYKLRSKLRASLNLESNDQLLPALKAWSNQE